jgi:BirA family biotin operon repressor/biotin-[acetyl-CoA-carboxylase] ligase
VSDLDPERVRPLLRGAFGEPLLYEDVCPSTQDLLRGRGLPEGAVAVAEHQTAGRGRSGRTWEDAPGGALLCSLLLRPPAGATLPELSLAVGLAAAEAIEDATGLRALVKWPNDVVLGSSKVAGALLEAGDGEVVCGIGVNVASAPAATPDAVLPATSLQAQTGSRQDRAELLARLLARLERRYRDWLEGGLEGMSGELRARHFLAGRAVLADGERARAGAISPDGRLELVSADGRRRLVESGEIRLADI